MTPVVCDASILVELLLRTGRAGSLEELLSPSSEGLPDLHVPALCDIEVAAALRRVRATGELSDERLGDAVMDYADFPLTRHGHLHLVSRVLSLRHNFSAYDATYVALAEYLGATLATADGRLRRAAVQHLDLPVL